MLIYVIIYCPQAQGTIIFICILIGMYLNCILFCIFSCFIGGRAKFNNSVFILALCMFICLLKFDIIQYILKYKCICICIFHTILTVVWNTQIAHLSIIPELHSVYLVFFPSVPPLGMLLSTHRGLKPKVSTQ